MKNISVQTEGRQKLWNESESIRKSFEFCYEAKDTENGERYFAEYDPSQDVLLTDNVKLYALSACEPGSTSHQSTNTCFLSMILLL